MPREAWTVVLLFVFPQVAEMTDVYHHMCSWDYRLELLCATNWLFFSRIDALC
jgi:hypothetical protein